MSFLMWYITNEKTIVGTQENTKNGTYYANHQMKTKN